MRTIPTTIKGAPLRRPPAVDRPRAGRAASSGRPGPNQSTATSAHIDWGTGEVTTALPVLGPAGPAVQLSLYSNFRGTRRTLARSRRRTIKRAASAGAVLPEDAGRRCMWRSRDDEHVIRSA
jgi:hypothetical protein